MKREPKLTRSEKQLEKDLLNGIYVDVSPQEFDRLADAIKSYRKDAVLNMRLPKRDLDAIKKKAKKLGVKYQSLISEFLHKLAQS